VQIGVSEVAVVNTESFALTVVVTLCQCREMDVKEEQVVAIKFCYKVDFSTTKTVELIHKSYGDAALSQTTTGEHSSRPKKVPFQYSRLKIMLIVFLDSQGIVHIEFVQESGIFHAEYY
jgi:hypothetical protein